MSAGPAQTEQKPITAFVISLFAGFWMLASGGMMYAFGWDNWNDMMQGMGGWMWGHGMMRGWMPGFWWPWFGAIAGIVVLLSAVMLYAKPTQSQSWGIVILIASILNFFIGMGGLLAASLGVIGGILAMSWKPQS
ncbi:hypothetical protein HYR54_10320 [Candidatus Acetothermia bacterium]|nr:hypothetical protein [Candidatus Acetothermia bacterium]MBI3660779.1 hypothetical protein [Candidatus Acetothermia bacterium]